MPTPSTVEMVGIPSLKRMPPALSVLTLPLITRLFPLGAQSYPNTNEVFSNTNLGVNTNTLNGKPKSGGWKDDEEEGPWRRHYWPEPEPEEEYGDSVITVDTNVDNTSVQPIPNYFHPSANELFSNTNLGINTNTLNGEPKKDWDKRASEWWYPSESEDEDDSDDLINSIQAGFDIVNKYVYAAVSKLLR
jgi:hypothetical protein